MCVVCAVGLALAGCATGAPGDAVSSGVGTSSGEGSSSGGVTPSDDATADVTTPVPWSSAPGSSPTSSDKVPTTSAPNSTTTFVLRSDQGQVSCGFNLCSDGSLPIVNVIVDHSTVIANLCLSQEIDVSNQQDVLTCTGMSGQTHWWMWKGTRTGATATVTPLENPSPFVWAVITFSSDQPDAVPTSITTADKCQRVDGSYGTVDGLGCA